MIKLPAYLEGRISFIKAPSRDAHGDAAPVEEVVKTILADVAARGDEAVRFYSKKFDHAEVDALEVGMAERRAAVAALDGQMRADTQFAIDNVRAFAQAQLATIAPLDVELLPGVHLGHRVIPIERVGCYVPGGRYPLLSAPVMSIVPARVAGVAEVIACLPPNAHQAMIAGCHLSGADRIFRVGGAQAIAAMAFGTASIPKVDKIVGPGNAFVNEAKRQVFGPVGIDQLAGPSEIFIVADATGDARVIAADLLGQAEHDVRTRVGLITTDQTLASGVLREVADQLTELATAPVASAAWRDYGEIVLARDEAAMIAYANWIAAEHLQVHTRDAHATSEQLTNYGSLFIGENASVVYSDKCIGTNHTLPTMAAGRYTGGLWVGAYVKVCTYQWLEDRALETVALPAIRQSASESLEGHRRAAAIRLERRN